MNATTLSTFAPGSKLSLLATKAVGYAPVPKAFELTVKSVCPTGLAMVTQNERGTTVTMVVRLVDGAVLVNVGTQAFRVVSGL